MTLEAHLAISRAFSGGILEIALNVGNIIFSIKYSNTMLPLIFMVFGKVNLKEWNLFLHSFRMEHVS